MNTHSARIIAAKTASNSLIFPKRQQDGNFDILQSPICHLGPVNHAGLLSPKIDKKIRIINCDKYMYSISMIFSMVYSWLKDVAYINRYIKYNKERNCLTASKQANKQTDNI